MPELPDIEVYRACLTERVVGKALERLRVGSPFLVRSVSPPLEAVHGRQVCEVRRLGKRLVFALDGGLFVVIHLMIAGRLRWAARGAKLPAKIGLAAIDFANGTLLLTEASTRKRASLHVVEGEAALALHDPGGLEPLGIDAAKFRSALTRENRTLKRALTDPRIFAGIGNVYSDEILHAARLSPLMLTGRITDAEIARLHEAVRQTLRRWTDELIDRFKDRFPGPGDITAFRPGFAVHGRFGKPCPRCGTSVQRIRYAENEANYCPRCQTNGKVLADRSLSRLLRDDWPRTIEELEAGSAPIP